MAEKEVNVFDVDFDVVLGSIVRPKDKPFKANAWKIAVPDIDDVTKLETEG